MATDFYWTLDGDFALGADGDLRDTSFDPLRSTWQEMRTRVRSSTKDWAPWPSLGANLDELIGSPNNRITAEEGKTKIISALTMNGFMKKEQLNIRYVPITENRLVYFIRATVFVPSTIETRLLQLVLLYDTFEGEAALL